MNTISLSVVMPTYNCRALLGRHIDAMLGWIDLADEIIVVDSRSTDGSLQFIRDRLRHPKIRFIERERGLYASWNEGISSTVGSWVYISTAGDTIDRTQLLHLHELGERTAADVVISQPRFVDERGEPIPELKWPAHEIIANCADGSRPFMLSPTALAILASIHCPGCILGSSASNLYRGDVLRARPFPTDFRGGGDTVWLMRHSLSLRACLTPRVGSVFCVHRKDESLTPTEAVAFMLSLQAEKLSLARGIQEAATERDWSILIEEAMLQGQARALLQRRRAGGAAGPARPWALARWVWLTAAYGWHRTRVRWVRRNILEALFGSKASASGHCQLVP